MRVISWTVRETGGPVQPGGAANLLAIVYYDTPPIEAYFHVEGFGQSMDYGPIRDFTNPLIMEMTFQIPLGVSFPHVTVTGWNITKKYPVTGEPFVYVTLYVKQGGKWVKVGTKKVPVTVIGAKAPSKALSTPAKKKSSLLLPVLLVGGALLLGGGSGG